MAVPIIKAMTCILMMMQGNHHPTAYGLSSNEEDVRLDIQDSNYEDEENEDESKDARSQVTMSKMKSFDCVDFLTLGGLSSSLFYVALPTKT